MSSVKHPRGRLQLLFPPIIPDMHFACNPCPLDEHVHKPQCRKNSLRPQLEAQASEHAPQNGMALCGSGISQAARLRMHHQY